MKLRKKENEKNARKEELRKQVAECKSHRVNVS
jgi:hypothetical protein